MKNSTRIAMRLHEVFWRIEVEVLAGKQEEFQAVVSDLIPSSKKEPGTLDYDWYFDGERRVCHTYERYRDSDAVIAHATTFGAQFAERFRRCCRQISLDVYGSPSEAARGLLSKYDASFFERWQGFED
ncbi:putative quinol monooxygenase [Occallatibacter savannae]|uniref:putative quinol monooxygenase n=1 Tax=Occallatibacter savannae TaxID=1002691 RepID=UPI0013A5B641|nr:antibiotic biosynthesis monooxygenase [Occallatibacter savannae]